MPIDLNSIPEHLREAVSAGNVVPFIGAGVSRLAKGNPKQPLPTWNEFMEDLLEVARFKGLQDHDEVQIRDLIKNGKFLMAAQALKEAIGDGHELPHYIRKRFLSSGAEPGDIHYSLFKLRPQIIMTTNYDVLLEQAARKLGRDVETVTPDKAHLIQQVLKGYESSETPLIFKIHGTAKDPDNIIFAERDYRELLYGLRGYRAVLSALFVTKVVLMLGFSNSDPEITMVLQTLREGFRQRSSPDYIVLKRGVKGSVEKRRLSHDFGLEVIEYDPSDNHNELVQLVEHLAKSVRRKPRVRASAPAPAKPVNATPHNDL